MSRYRVACGIWAFGAGLIVLSWTAVVGPTVGWIGFGLAVAGSVVGWGQSAHPRAGSDTVALDRRQAAERERMLNASLGAGLMIQTWAVTSIEDGRPTPASCAFLLLGTLLIVHGCALYCERKGYPRSLGLLGTLSMVGYFILALLPNRSARQR